MSGERETLLEYLGHYRSELERKCAGLSSEQLAHRAVPPSTLSLLGLVRHLAEVEQYWFRRVMERQDVAALYSTAEQRDLDFDGAVADDGVVEEAWAAWRHEVAYADELVAAAESLEIEGAHRDGPIALREVLVHLIEEYARHLGHADLLRQCIDGSTG